MRKVLMLRCRLSNSAFITFCILAFYYTAIAPQVLTAQETKRAPQPEFAYGLSVRAKNMVVRLYINGAPVAFHASIDEMSYYSGAERYLHPGENTITVDYEPINPATRTYTPNQDVQIYIELDQMQRGVDFGKIDIFHGRYNAEHENLEAVDAHILTGTALVTQAGNMTSPTKYQIAPIDMNYPDRSSGEHARRLTLTFSINDETLGVLPQEEAIVLEDTPELREKLYIAYQEIHAAYVQENVQAYGQLMAPVLNRFAYVRGYEGREEEVLRHQVENNPLGGREGESIRPLAPLSTFQKSHLSWGSDMRMVAFSDDPITYLDESGEAVGGIKIMFCSDQQNNLFICHKQ